jgi:hypothetical protein
MIEDSTRADQAEPPIISLTSKLEIVGVDVDAPADAGTAG